MAKLKNKKREIFCQEYLKDLNATQAAVRAGYCNSTANEQGARLLSNIEIQERIAILMDERVKRLEIEQDKIVKELCTIALSKITDYARLDINDNGNEELTILPTEQIPPEKIGAIARYKRTKSGVEIILHDKMKALELLGRHIGMFVDKETLELRKKELELKGW